MRLTCSTSFWYDAFRFSGCFVGIRLYEEVIPYWLVWGRRCIRDS